MGSFCTSCSPFHDDEGGYAQVGKYNHARMTKDWDVNVNVILVAFLRPLLDTQQIADCALLVKKYIGFLTDTLTVSGYTDTWTRSPDDYRLDPTKCFQISSDKSSLCHLLTIYGDETTERILLRLPEINEYAQSDKQWAWSLFVDKHAGVTIVDPDDDVMELLELCRVLVNHPKVRKYRWLAAGETLSDAYTVLLSMNDGREYALEFSSKKWSRAQTFRIVNQSSKRNIYALHSPKAAVGTVHWMLYDEAARKFKPYLKDELLSQELDAVYHANLGENDQISCNHANLGDMRDLFSRCYLARYSELVGCNHGMICTQVDTGDIVMDQVRLADSKKVSAIRCGTKEEREQMREYADLRRQHQEELRRQRQDSPELHFPPPFIKLGKFADFDPYEALDTDEIAKIRRGFKGAMEKGTDSLVKYYQQDHPQLNLIDTTVFEDGSTCLHVAVRIASHELVRYLLANGRSVESLCVPHVHISLL